MLVIDNQNITATAPTHIDILLDRMHNSQKGKSEISKALVIRGKANVMITGEHHGLTFDELKVEDGSIVKFHH